MKVTIELEVTPSNQAGLKDFVTSLVNLSQGTSPDNPISSEIADPMPEDPEPAAPTSEPAPVPESPAKKTRTRSKKEAPAPETNSPASEPAADPDPESRQGQPHLPTYDHLPEAGKPEVNAKPRYTIEWVRNLLAEKVGKYRAECKQKLSELGAANVSSLDPEKYSDFVDFLNTLNV